MIWPSSLGFIKSSRSKRRRMRLAYTHLILKMPLILMSATCKRPVLFGTPSAVAAAGGSFKFVSNMSMFRALSAPLPGGGSCSSSSALRGSSGLADGAYGGARPGEVPGRDRTCRVVRDRAACPAAGRASRRRRCAARRAWPTGRTVVRDRAKCPAGGRTCRWCATGRRARRRVELLVVGAARLVGLGRRGVRWCATERSARPRIVHAG